MAVYVNELYGPTKPIRVEAEDIGDLTRITITIDRKELVAAALPALIQKLNAPAPAPKKKRKSPTKKTAPKEDLPGQSFMPGTTEKEKSWAAPGGAAFPFGANVPPAATTAPPSPAPSPTPSAPPTAKAKNPLHGVAVVTNPGESLAAAKERVKREQAAPAVTA